MDENNFSPGLWQDGERTGNEPVISGMGSRILADRRGAYLAGNLKALLQQMTTDQQVSFKRWCVRLAVRRAREVLHLFEAYHSRDNRPRRAIEAAEAWLAESEREEERFRDRGFFGERFINLLNRTIRGSAERTAARAGERAIAQVSVGSAAWAAGLSATNAAEAASGTPLYAARGCLYAAQFAAQAEDGEEGWRRAHSAVQHAQMRIAYGILERGTASTDD